MYRLIQGAGSEIEAVVPRLWITERGLCSLKSRLKELRGFALNLQEAVDRGCAGGGIGSPVAVGLQQVDVRLLHEIHDTIDRMDRHVERLHETVENYSFKWGKRGKKRIIPIPTSGSYIPMSLIIPVTVDCIVDGFLLGTTSAISLRAGIVLAFANMIEMGFLGLAVSVRIQKCTGSSVAARYASLVLPPLIMLLSSVLGAMCGALSRNAPTVYIGFISFGIVALVYLVVNELLVEAREALEGQEQWWTALTLFAGIYAVIVLDLVL